MPSLDIFNGDAFNVVSMTTAINKLPVAPARIGQLNLFRTEGINTTTAMVEEKSGRLMIVPTAARGTMPNVMGGPRRKLRAFVVPHIPLNAAVMADDVQGVRAFGSETDVETVANLVNEKLQAMRDSFELTHEWHRIGAISGIIIDADASTVLYNLFTEFSITPPVAAFEFDDTQDVKARALAVIRWIEDALGATPYRQIRALCGDEFFDALVGDATVKAAFEEGNAFFRTQQAQVGDNKGEFEFAGIIWENYRAKLGSTHFIPTDECRFFPEGVVDLFSQIFSPAPFMETVNTTGKPFYAKQERMKWDLGTEMHANSSPLMMCKRPAVLVKGIIGAIGTGTLEVHTMAGDDIRDRTGTEKYVLVQPTESDRLRAWRGMDAEARKAHWESLRAGSDDFQVGQRPLTSKATMPERPRRPADLAITPDDELGETNENSPANIHVDKNDLRDSER